MLNRNLCLVYYCEFGDTIVSQNLGVESLAAFLEPRGWRVRLFNLFYEKSPAAAIASTSPAVVGFSVMTETAATVARFATEYRLSGGTGTILFGGPGATAEPELLLHRYSAIDGVVSGEGEVTLFEVSEKVARGEPFERTPGVWCRRDGKVAFAGARPLVAELDSLPLPDSSGLMRPESLRFTTTASSRGCLGGCGFCFNALQGQPGRRHRTRSASNFVKHLSDSVRRNGVRRFAFIDQTFEDGASGKFRIGEIAKCIVISRLDIVYTVHVRTENWTSEDQGLLDTLRESGLIGVFPGLESGTERGLRLFRKPATIDSHRTAIALFRRNRLLVDIGWINIHPYSTVEELRQNAQFLSEIGFAHLTHLFHNRLVVFPKTPIAEMVAADGLSNVAPSLIDPQSLVAYEFQDASVRWLVNRFLSEDRMKRVSKIASRVYKLCLDWEFITSLLWQREEESSCVRELLTEMAARREALFRRLAVDNLSSFDAWLLAATEQWSSERCREMDSAFTYDYLESEAMALSSLRFKTLATLSRKGKQHLVGLLHAK
jgi:anaerobic magnesium-protoporphyrin IX monomethyl ester cyclase